MFLQGLDRRSYRITQRNSPGHYIQPLPGLIIRLYCNNLRYGSTTLTEPYARVMSGGALKPFCCRPDLYRGKCHQSSVQHTEQLKLTMGMCGPVWQVVQHSLCVLNSRGLR